MKIKFASLFPRLSETFHKDETGSPDSLETKRGLKNRWQIDKEAPDSTVQSEEQNRGLNIGDRETPAAEDPLFNENWEINSNHWLTRFGSKSLAQIQDCLFSSETALGGNENILDRAIKERMNERRRFIYIGIAVAAGKLQEKLLDTQYLEKILRTPTSQLPFVWNT